MLEGFTLNITSAKRKTLASCHFGRTVSSKLQYLTTFPPDKSRIFTPDIYLHVSVIYIFIYLLRNRVDPPPLKTGQNSQFRDQNSYNRLLISIFSSITIKCGYKWGNSGILGSPRKSDTIINCY